MPPIDVELAKTLATVLAALAGALMGAVIGPLINRGASLEASRRTMEGQRRLAQDEAGRRLRQSAVEPVLALVFQRSGRYLLWWNAIFEGRDDAALRVNQFELWQHTGWPLEPGFSELFSQYLDVDTRLDARLRQARASGADQQAAALVGEDLSAHVGLSREVVRVGYEYIIGAPISLDSATAPLRRFGWVARLTRTRTPRRA